MNCLAKLRSFNEEGREFHREIALGRKELRIVEDLEKGRFRFKGGKNVNYKRTGFEMKKSQQECRAY